VTACVAPVASRSVAPVASRRESNRLAAPRQTAQDEETLYTLTQLWSKLAIDIAQYY